METSGAAEELTINSLRKTLFPIAKADRRQSTLQILNTFVPYIALWVVLLYMIDKQYPVWVIFPLILLAALFLVRIFILFHDCTHSSFFASHRANAILGFFFGLLAFTPFTYWQHNHLTHHATFADLDNRGLGDVTVMTVEEYHAASPLKRLAYRLYRNPFVYLILGPGYFFLIDQRFTKGNARNDRISVAVTNASIIAIVLAADQTIGLRTYIAIQLPVILIAGAIGLWMFYIQHNFEGVYWSRHEQWVQLKAALQGSSYYKLPRILQWFTGNIGFHHAHHVLPRIPNFKLQLIHDSSPVLQAVKPLSLGKSLKAFSLNLYDEKQGKLVSFKTFTP
jgi:acyl-lipid omega-6 desaturase (Delta-12 desaturase)